MRRIAVLTVALASCGGAAEEPRVSSPVPSVTASPSAESPSQSVPARPSATPTGKVAPPFTLERLDGGTFRLADFRNKIPVALNFWAPW